MAKINTLFMTKTAEEHSMNQAIYMKYYVLTTDEVTVLQFGIKTFDKTVIKVRFKV